MAVEKCEMLVSRDKPTDFDAWYVKNGNPRWDAATFAWTPVSGGANPVGYSQTQDGNIWNLLKCVPVEKPPPLPHGGWPAHVTGKSRLLTAGSKADSAGFEAWFAANGKPVWLGRSHKWVVYREQYPGQDKPVPITVGWSLTRSGPIWNHSRGILPTS